MKYLSPFRLASYLLVLSFAGHTAGGMPTSWYGIWFAFGLLASVFLLFSAIAAWQLETYIFATPAIFATLVTILLAAGAWLKQRAR